MVKHATLAQYGFYPIVKLMVILSTFTVVVVLVMNYVLCLSKPVDYVKTLVFLCMQLQIT